jgi:hypothetical protein
VSGRCDLVETVTVPRGGLGRETGRTSLLIPVKRKTTSMVYCNLKDNTRLVIYRRAVCPLE